jgi:hypothetical protein
MPHEFLHISPKVTVLPIIHGSGDFAIEVRRVMLGEDFDCLAVPLPPSFQSHVERGIEHLPSISVAVQEEPRRFSSQPWSGEADDEDDDDDDDERAVSYVPIDPCQGVIAALRIALQERMPRAFIDLETECFESIPAVLPDPYALKTVSVEKFAAAVLPGIPRLRGGQPRDRVIHMANRLRELESRHERILFVCSMMDWPWIREAYVEQTPASAEHEDIEETSLYAADIDTLIFLLGELPYVTSLYERARAELDDDENLSIDGLKELLIESRSRYAKDFKTRARTISPKALAIYFQYVRNLSLIERRFTPDLYTLVVAAQQIVGDQFAVQVAETARDYFDTGLLPFETLRMGVGQASFPNGDVVEMKSRLPGHPVSWRSFELKPNPPKIDQQKWRMRWNPFAQCSWPEEDVAIENFRTHVKDAALAMMGADLARSEKFSASLKDGLDIRETLRNWHTGDLYVKVFPPTRGNLDCVIMLFDSPADPRDYPWRITWQAEHHDESTLSLFATDYHQEMVGPGIGLAQYGGAVFLFPPRPVSDIFRDPQFDFVDTLEERLIAGGCAYAKERHVAILSHAPPGAGWRRLAKQYGKKLVHVPMGRFSQQTIQQLRMVHVLNGQEIRSFASHFIRKA